MVNAVQSTNLQNIRLGPLTPQQAAATHLNSGVNLQNLSAQKSDTFDGAKEEKHGFRNFLLKTAVALGGLYLLARKGKGHLKEGSKLRNYAEAYVTKVDDIAKGLKTKAQELYTTVKGKLFKNADEVAEKAA